MAEIEARPPDRDFFGVYVIIYEYWIIWNFGIRVKSFLQSIDRSAERRPTLIHNSRHLKKSLRGNHLDFIKNIHQMRHHHTDGISNSCYAELQSFATKAPRHKDFLKESFIL
jgi:hypothetical protein